MAILSARAQPGTFVYDEVKRAAAAFASLGCDIVTGGGLGLMQAANEGAKRRAGIGRHSRRTALRAGRESVCRAGVRARNVLHTPASFRDRSDAFVVVPGGIGTVLEMLMIWQLLQVRHVNDVPLILVGKMWKGLVDWTKTAMLDPRLALANPEDLTIPQCLESTDEAIAVVRDLHAKWKARQPQR